MWNDATAAPFLYRCTHDDKIFRPFPRIFNNFSESIEPISKMLVPFYSSFQGLSIEQISCSQI